MKIELTRDLVILMEAYWTLENWADRTDREYVNAINSLRVLIEKELTHEVLDNLNSR